MRFFYLVRNSRGDRGDGTGGDDKKKKKPNTSALLSSIHAIPLASPVSAQDCWAAGQSHHHGLLYSPSAPPTGRTPVAAVSHPPPCPQMQHVGPPPCSRRQQGHVPRSPRALRRRSAFRHQDTTHLLSQAGRTRSARHRRPGTLPGETLPLLCSTLVSLLQPEITPGNSGFFAEREFQGTKNVGGKAAEERESCHQVKTRLGESVPRTRMGTDSSEIRGVGKPFWRENRLWEEVVATGRGAPETGSPTAAPAARRSPPGPLPAAGPPHPPATTQRGPAGAGGPPHLPRPHTPRGPAPRPRPRSGRAQRRAGAPATRAGAAAAQGAAVLTERTLMRSGASSTHAILADATAAAPAAAPSRSRARRRQQQHHYHRRRRRRRARPHGGAQRSAAGRGRGAAASRPANRPPPKPPLPSASLPPPRTRARLSPHTHTTPPQRSAHAPVATAHPRRRLCAGAGLWRALPAEAGKAAAAMAAGGAVGSSGDGPSPRYFPQPTGERGAVWPALPWRWGGGRRTVPQAPSQHHSCFPRPASTQGH